MRTTGIILLSAMLTTNLFASDVTTLKQDVTVSFGSITIEGENKQMVASQATLLDYRNHSNTWLTRVIITSDDSRFLDNSIGNAQKLHLEFETRLTKDVFFNVGLHQLRTYSFNQVKFLNPLANCSIYTNWNSGKHSLRFGAQLFAGGIRMGNMNVTVPIPTLGYRYDFTPSTSLSLGYDEEAPIRFAYKNKTEKFGFAWNLGKEILMPPATSITADAKNILVFNAPTLETEVSYQITQHLKLVGTIGVMPTLNSINNSDGIDEFVMTNAYDTHSYSQLFGISLAGSW